MKTISQRVSFAFRRAPDAGMLAAAQGIIRAMKMNANFPNPPISMDVLQGFAKEFRDAMAAASQGGTSLTAEKNKKREELYTKLQAVGWYVQMASKNDLAILLSSGFEAISNNNTKRQLDQPAIKSIRNGMARQSLITVIPVKNSRCYMVEYALAGEDGALGPWVRERTVTRCRNIPVDGLISGKVYIYRARAVGGLTGYSDWSDSVSHRAY
ncbi:MAG: fibronectin type III domain-containing protein [Luteolibacter sp.]